MKKQNVARKIITIALIAGGIALFGVENRTRAEDRSGLMLSGGRSGSTSTNAVTTETGGGMGSGNISDASGILGSSGGRAENANSGSEPQTVGFLTAILEFFF